MPNLNVGLGAAMPAFAESFPSNGIMLENKTYSNAATFENMGTYDGDGTLSAIAEYVDNTQDIIGGTYLPAGATVAEQCPANHWCYGMTDATVNASESQGATRCANTMPYSAVGSVSNTQCYTTCTLQSANIEHATEVSGGVYFSSQGDVNRCFATACENGYHVNNRLQTYETWTLIKVDHTVAGDDYGYISADYMGGRNDYEYGLTKDNTWAAQFDYGVVYGRASCQATSPETVMDYLGENMDAIMAGTKPLYQVRRDLTPIFGEAKTNYLLDLLARTVDGDTVGDEELDNLFSVFSLVEDASFSTSDTGEFCYCQMTGFQSGSGTSGVVNIATAPWVYQSTTGSADRCDNECAQYCGERVMENVDFRKAILGAVRVTNASTCDANRIKIEWTDAAEEDIAANNAGMCTYGGDIRTPIKAATIPDKTFIGWKFRYTPAAQ